MDRGLIDGISTALTEGDAKIEIVSKGKDYKKWMDADSNLVTSTKQGIEDYFKQLIMFFGLVASTKNMEFID